MIFYFSGCGNSKHVAETMATEWNDKLVFIPEAAREVHFDYTLKEGESLGFVFPIYSWGPPHLVLDFLKKLQLNTNPDYVFFVYTCGDNCGHTEKVFRKELQEKGWALSACFSLIMPETYIGMAGFKLDTEENAQRKIKEADAKLKRFMPRLANKEQFSEMIVGSFPWLKTYMVNPGFNRSATDDSKYRFTEKCISCGKCVKVCPLQNITLEDGHPKWHGHCTICMACYHYCPTNSIQYGKATEGKGQYFFS